LTAPLASSAQTRYFSPRFNRTIYAVNIEGDLRVVFFIKDDLVVTVDIGTHDIYKG
jgi:hypothetical protein